MRDVFKVNWKRADKGVAAIEFAIILPVLLLTFIGLFDVGEFIYCNNKMNRTAQDISNIVTRGDLTKPQLDALLKAASLTSQPFDFTAGSGNVIVTSVSNPSGTSTQVMWRDSYPGGTSASRINPMSLPGGITLSAGNTVIFTEVFYTYAPLIPGYILQPSNTAVYAIAAAVPRKGNMTTLPSS